MMLRSTKKTLSKSSGQPTCKLSGKLRSDLLSLREALRILDLLALVIIKAKSSGCHKRMLLLDTKVKK